MRPTCFVGRVSDADFSRDALQGGEAERDGPVGRCVPGGYQHAAVYPLQARQDEFTRATRRHRVEGVVVCRIIRNGLSVADGFQQRKFEDGERRGTYVERELPADVFQPGKRSRIRFACLAAVAAEKRSPHFDEIRQRERERGLRSAIFDREVIAAFRRQREFGNMRESGDPQGIEVFEPGDSERHRFRLRRQRRGVDPQRAAEIAAPELRQSRRGDQTQVERTVRRKSASREIQYAFERRQVVDRQVA